MSREELEKEVEVCMHNALFWLKLPISKENVEKGSSYIFELLEPREKRIEELEAANKKISNECHKLVDNLEKEQNENAELKAQIEKMKCCQNCKKLEKDKDGLLFCTVGSFYTNAFGKNCDKWEIKEKNE